MSMEFLKTIGISAGWLTSILVFGFTVYKLFIKKWWARHKAAQQQKWETIANDLKMIKGQVFPNGGGSIVDMQRKTMNEIKEISNTIGSLTNGQRNILDIMDIPSWESDEEGKVTFVNTALCDLIGATPQDLLGNSWVGRVAFWDRDKVVKEWRESIENASDFNVPHSLRRNDDQYQKVCPSVIHNKDKEGKVINSLGRLTKVGEPYPYQNRH